MILHQEIYVSWKKEGKEVGRCIGRGGLIKNANEILRDYPHRYKELLDTICNNILPTCDNIDFNYDKMMDENEKMIRFEYNLSEDIIISTWSCIKDDVIVNFLINVFNVDNMLQL